MIAARGAAGIWRSADKLFDLLTQSLAWNKDPIARRDLIICRCIALLHDLLIADGEDDATTIGRSRLCIGNVGLVRRIGQTTAGDDGIQNGFAAGKRISALRVHFT